MIAEKSTIISFMRSTGPLLPAKVAKQFQMDLLFASARLSEMTSEGTVKISNLKIGGGSPLYYLPGQEHLLDNFAEHLGSKDREVFQRLKKEEVLEDEKQDPLTRVSLASLKDFAVPLQVRIEKETKKFWRFHTLSKEQVQEKIRALVYGTTDKVEAKQETIVVKKIEKNKNTQVGNEKTSNNVKEEEPLQKEKIKQELPIKNPISKPIEKKEEKEVQVQSGNQPDKRDKKAAKDKKKEKKEAIPKEEKQTLLEGSTPIIFPENDKLIDEARAFCDKKEITFEELTINRKNADADAVVGMKTAIGNVRFYMKIKKKKKVNEGDLSTLLVQAHLRKLPAIVLLKGELTKKTQEQCKKEFKDILIINL